MWSCLIRFVIQHPCIIIVINFCSCIQIFSIQSECNMKLGDSAGILEVAFHKMSLNFLGKLMSDNGEYILKHTEKCSINVWFFSRPQQSNIHNLKWENFFFCKLLCQICILSLAYHPDFWYSKICYFAFK